MKIKHIMLLIITVLTIGFLQPLVMLIGGFTLIAGVLAWIYSDLPPEKQNAWESRIAHFMEQLRNGLRKQPKPYADTPILDSEPRPKIKRSTPVREELVQVGSNTPDKEYPDRSATPS
ncbi:MAG: hypothetical protein H6970_11815 [Gammaproteobacteria bacterium]|nr:hypothetical protein [Gammaproteobacteria bacterium]MCP5458656.1 hypothetical protein [Gammaproteobacteria bacterium]